MESENYRITRVTVKEILAAIGLKGNFIELHADGMIISSEDSIMDIKTGGK